MASLDPGSRLGPYEIVSLIGTGGMGEVYRARDTRLERTVAIKVLPPSGAADPEHRARFLREARAVSAIQHPHVCALHDVGEQDGTAFLVMEYLEGETLAARLHKGALPAEQVLSVGLQVADALARAHREGIVHRDLKPANVMLTPGGAKLLDFGIAKAPRTPSEPDLLTTTGQALGTYPYMAPEQIEGRAVDHRADLWSLGCLLFEMATGRRAFEGSSQITLIMSIMGGDTPDLGRGLPPGLAHVIRNCLVRDPEARWQSAADVARELGWLAGGTTGSGIRPRPPGVRRRLTAGPALTAALGAAALLGAGGWWRAAHPPPAPAILTSILPPPGAVFDGLAGAPALSPDGGSIALVARDESGVSRLYVRRLDDATPRLLPGTEGALRPFWSPDGASLGYYAGSAVYRLALAGGEPEAVMVSPFMFGGSWGRDGVIVVGSSIRGPLTWISPAHPEPAPLAPLDPTRGETAHLWPQFLSDGRRVAFVVLRTDPVSGHGEREVWVAAPGDPARHLVGRVASNAIPAPGGHLLSWLDGNLVAQDFDERTLTLSDQPRVVAKDVMWNGERASGLFSASGRAIAFAPGGTIGLSRLVLVDRTGAQTGVVAGPGSFWTPRVSSDGRHVTVEVIDPATGNRDVQVLDLTRAQAPLRVTFGIEDDFTPVWSPDGQRLAYTTVQGDRWSVHVRDVWGTADRAVFEAPGPVFPTDWSAARGILLNRSLASTSSDVWALDPDGGKVAELIVTPAVERDASVSPDGRLLAYVSWASGRPEVLVQPPDATGVQWQVSPQGGSQPRWAPSGRELFYVSAAGSLVAVPVDPAARFPLGNPRELFPARLRRAQITQYDVLPRGDGFLLNVRDGEETFPALSLLLDWSPARLP